MQRSLFIFLFFVFSSYSSICQQNTFIVKGKVVSPQSDQVVGATLTIKELQRGTRSELDGTYIIKNVPAGVYTLQCRYLGYRNVETQISVSANTIFNIRMGASSSELNTIVVSSKRNSESEVSAKKDEQAAENLVNIISARTIQLSPDITIANVLQRVSGVSLERSSSGDGRYAIIRGMDQRFNYTLVNGIKIPSPDNKNRYVPLDIFPAELVERVEINKTLSPNMEGDAIGGTVNMVMKNAPDKFYFNSSLSTGYSQNLFNRSYTAFPVSAINRKSPFEANGSDYSAQPGDFTRDNLSYTSKRFRPNALASLSVGDRFFNNKFGVMLGGSFQNTFKSYNSIYNPGEYTDASNSEGQLKIKHANIRDFSNQLTRTGLNAKLDLRINPRNKISFYSFLAMLSDAQNRMTRDTLQPAPRTRVGTGQVWYYGRSKYQHQSIYNGTLQGEHSILAGLKFDWTGAWSMAKSNIPDLAEYEYDSGYFQDGTNPQPYQHPNKVTNYNRIWENNSDRDVSGYANLAYSNKVFHFPYTVSVGGMYRTKHRDNLYQDYELRTVPNSDGSFQLWTDIYHFNWTVFNPGGSPANPNSYRANEDISAGYGMLKFAVRKLETLVGVRLENTSQDFNTDVPVTSAGKTGTISYQDILPSIHLKYLLNDKTNLRLSYFSSINRPGYFEIIPTRKEGDEYTEIGNPNIKHATADNLDARFEFFPKPNEQVLIGAFYKNITNPIEYGFVGQKADEYQPQNFGNATNFGFEVVFEKYIKKFGARLNYTYTNSSITTNKIKTFNNERITPAPSETRPLQGQSAHIANAALLYKNVRHGIDFQLAWQYTGKRIALVSPYFGFDQWQKALNMFDLSAEKKIGKGFAVFTKIQNLLNAPDEFYIKKPVSNSVTVPYQDMSSNQTLSKRNLYSQNYQLGLRYIL